MLAAFSAPFRLTQSARAVALAKQDATTVATVLTIPLRCLPMCCEPDLRVSRIPRRAARSS